jgi:hypothetical protein
MRAGPRCAHRPKPATPRCGTRARAALRGMRRPRRFAHTTVARVAPQLFRTMRKPGSKSRGSRRRPTRQNTAYARPPSHYRNFFFAASCTRVADSSAASADGVDDIVLTVYRRPPGGVIRGATAGVFSSNPKEEAPCPLFDSHGTLQRPQLRAQSVQAPQE